jgi:hypothetical protein
MNLFWINHKDKLTQELIDNYVALTTVLKLQLYNSFKDNHSKATPYEDQMERLAISAVLGEDIETPMNEIKDKKLQAKVKDHRADIMMRAHEILSINKDFRKLIVFHLRAKTAMLRAKFGSDIQYFKSDHFLRIVTVIAPYYFEFEEEWTSQEYDRLIELNANRIALKN